MRLSNDAKRGLTYVLLVVIVVVGAQVAVGSALGSSPVYVVVSRSMVPTLEIGDLVITQSVPYSSIHVGQVIVFVTPTGSGTCAGLTVVHRVVAITNQGLITQGDDRLTNPHPDEPLEWPPIPPQCVKGVVRLAVPYLGLISMLIPEPWNYVIVALILIFVFLGELHPSRGNDEESRRQQGEEENEEPGSTRGGERPGAGPPPPGHATSQPRVSASRTTSRSPQSRS